MPLSTDLMYMPEVRLTIAQKLTVDWAAGAMDDFWTDAGEREYANEPVIERPVVITPKGVKVIQYRGVLEDLKYRLIEMYPDVVEEMEHCPRIATIRAAENAWLAIAEVAAVQGIINVEAK